MCVSIDLLQCTHEPNVSVPQMAGLLIERTQDTQWVVVFKALISTHTIMNYGNEVIPYCHISFKLNVKSCAFS